MDYLEAALLKTVRQMVGHGEAYTEKFYEEFSKLDTLIQIGVLLGVYQINGDESSKDRYITILATILSAVYDVRYPSSEFEKAIDDILEKGKKFLEKIALLHLSENKTRRKA